MSSHNSDSTHVAGHCYNVFVVHTVVIAALATPMPLTVHVVPFAVHPSGVPLLYHVLVLPLAPGSCCLLRQVGAGSPMLAVVKRPIGLHVILPEEPCRANGS